MTDISAPKLDYLHPPPAGDVVAARAGRGAAPATYVGAFYRMHALGAVFPVAAGAILYGWRAIFTLAVVVGSAAIGVRLWQRIGSRGMTMRLSHGLWVALLLALTLPPHLLAERFAGENAPAMPWTILPAAGLLVAMLMWLLGGVGASRVHPALVAHLLLTVLLRNSTEPHWVLQRANVLTGDVLDAPDRDSLRLLGNDGWTRFRSVAGQDALHFDQPASSRLTDFTTFRQPAGRSYFSLEALIRDDMPPLEDLIVGGHPSAIGTGSAIAVIIGGLFLLYRGVIDYRIPLLIVGATLLGLLCFPLPTVISESGAEWTSLGWALLRRDPGGIGFATTFTFANYQLMASPLLFMAFFIATAPSLRPMTRRGRTCYALATGLLAAALQLYLSVSYGPYLALLLASLLTPLFDRLFPAKTLV